MNNIDKFLNLPIFVFLRLRSSVEEHRSHEAGVPSSILGAAINPIKIPQERLYAKIHRLSII